MARTDRKRRWSDFSPPQKVAVVVLAAVELLVTGLAMRDLSNRPASEIRGPKLLWWPALLVQPLGSPLYLLFGRKRPAD